MKYLTRVAIGMTTLYVIVVAVIYASQRTLVFSASTERVAPKSVELAGTKEITLQNLRDENLYSWYTPAIATAPTILYLHGNGGSVSTRESIQQKFLTKGYGVLMAGYPGYGGSEGAPSETALIEAATIAYEYLTKLGVTADDIVILGESLGSSVAIQLAAKKPSAAVVLLAPMHSIREIAESQYPFLPMKLLLKDPFLSFEHIARVQRPFLVFHGSDDQAIPISSGKRLFELANEPKQFVVIEGAGHNNLFDFGIVKLMDEFLLSQRK